MKSWVEELSESSGLLPATEKALELGQPIMANNIIIGAVAGAGILPLNRSGFDAVFRDNMSADKQGLNRKPFDLGSDMTNNFEQDRP